VQQLTASTIQVEVVVPLQSTQSDSLT
jgi:hypothetical protein